MKSWRYFVLVLLMALALEQQCAAQKPETFHSAKHPFETPGANSRTALYRPVHFISRNGTVDLNGTVGNNGYGLALAATGKSETWYSAGVNQILCSSLLPNETWLGTAFGIKRLDLRVGMVT